VEKWKQFFSLTLLSPPFYIHLYFSSEPLAYLTNSSNPVNYGAKAWSRQKPGTSFFELDFDWGLSRREGESGMTIINFV
jgi:hypothetical protein